ncbi:MAG: hypothetical protein M3Z23_10610 [Acidobacteriota bacterium]|nr:hypothetical protein [Acidobacteriota bacterium]
MRNETGGSKATVVELAARFRAEMIPLGKNFSYFTATPVAEEDLKPYLHEPLGALPAALNSVLPRIGIVLVPYLEKGPGRGADVVTYQKPKEPRQLFSSAVIAGENATFFFAIKDEEVSEYHYSLYNAIASLVFSRLHEDARERFLGVLREELSARVHGEVDERSWRLKQALARREGKSNKESKLFREYAAQAFEDTLTLYLHGICCDIDVDTGPRQMPSRYLRKRLEALSELFPPPEGHAVFPEDGNRRERVKKKPGATGNLGLLQ